MTRRDVGAHFDSKASTYEEGRLGGWYKAQGAILLESLAGIRGPVLDVGCGTGWLLRRLVQRDPKVVGVGVDVSGGMIRVGRERAAAEGAGHLHLLQGDWEDPTVRASARESLGAPAEAVVCASAFHYFAEPEPALASFREVLAPGGRLLLFERALDGSPATAVWDFLHRHVVRDGARFYDLGRIRAMSDRCGFVDVRVTTRIRRLFWEGKLVSSLALIVARTPAGASRREVS